jgi:hypothetical protein
VIGGSEFSRGWEDGRMGGREESEFLGGIVGF